ATLGTGSWSSGAVCCSSLPDGHKTPMSAIARMTTTKPAAIFHVRPNGWELSAFSVMLPHPFFHGGCYTKTAIIVPAAVARMHTIMAITSPLTPLISRPVNDAKAKYPADARNPATPRMMTDQAIQYSTV